MSAARRVRHLRWLGAGLAAGLSAVALGSCTSARNDLGTGNSACYVAIAAATGAVHHHGELAGVRLEPVAALRARADLLYRRAQLDGQRSVCLVAFTGRYATGTVDAALGQRRGDVAVVEVGYPDRHVLATLLVTRQPLPFGHGHILPLIPF